MTLNAVPPKYIVNEVLMELHGNEHSPSNLELWRTVHECAQKVAENPNHGIRVTA